eukprot:scaffold453472_cov17-Prasinocladus_malaysianus.AAC.1
MPNKSAQQGSATMMVDILCLREETFKAQLHSQNSDTSSGFPKFMPSFTSSHDTITWLRISAG